MRYVISVLTTCSSQITMWSSARVSSGTKTRRVWLGQWRQIAKATLLSILSRSDRRAPLRRACVFDECRNNFPYRWCSARIRWWSARSASRNLVARRSSHAMVIYSANGAFSVAGNTRHGVSSNVHYAFAAQVLSHAAKSIWVTKYGCSSGSVISCFFDTHQIWRMCSLQRW